MAATRQPAVRFGLLSSFEAKVRDETNEHGEFVIDYVLGLTPALERVSLPPTTVSDKC